MASLHPSRQQMGAAVLAAVILLSVYLPHASSSSLRSESLVNPQRIYDRMKAQVDLGPRIPGSNASLAFGQWLKTQVPSAWNITTQHFIYKSIPMQNYYITDSVNGSYPSILIGAHYDSRARATQDTNQSIPVPGANDGASGVAGVLELIDILPAQIAPHIGFILFDGEDQGDGGMANFTSVNDWIRGSTYFVSQMSQRQIDTTKLFLLFDMIGDKSLNIMKEVNSDVTTNNIIFSLAAELGYSNEFINRKGYNMLDDHTPFIAAGIPSVDLIDFNYPQWHTRYDDMNHVSGVSVGIVTDVIDCYLTNCTTTSAITGMPLGNTSTQVMHTTTINGSETASVPVDFIIVVVVLLVLSIKRFKV